MSRRIRVAAWGIILALAAFQAYAQRYTVSPDGVSYLDLSDAIVAGRFGEFVNLYWSPLYPALVGIARWMTGAGAQTEVMVMHAVNFAAFVGLVASFDYFVIPVWSLAARMRGVALRGEWGAACLYGLFGTLAVTMTTLELTTPDLLSNAAVFFALGALLRLQQASLAGTTRPAIVLGAALGLGYLAKAFLMPWSIVCFVTLAVALRGRSWKPLIAAVSVWLIFVAPWMAILSVRAHRPTFGDAGRLTYAWYVNLQDPPSMHVVPAGARALDLETIIPGVGATGDAPGTDPMWFDPVRWNAPIAPHFSIGQQLQTIVAMSATLTGAFAVLSFFLFLLAAAPRGTLRQAWDRSWIVIVPTVCGIGGYMLVLMTARYIMAFMIAFVVMLLATVPVPRRLRPTELLVGIVLSMLPIAAYKLTSAGLALSASVLVAVWVGTLIDTRRHITWMVAIPLAFLAGIAALPPSLQGLSRATAAVFTILLWLGARVAIRKGKSEAFAFRFHVGLAFAIGLALVSRVVLRVVRDNAVRESVANGSAESRIADDLRAHGVEPGTRIAVIGPHAESYWARTARVKIVANVPDPLVHVWWLIEPDRRDSLLNHFAMRGAQVAIATRPPEGAAPDSTWTPLRYSGWIRRLSPASVIPSEARNLPSR